MNRNYDIQAIEDALADAVRKGGVSEKVFRGQRPNVKLDDYMTDFCVVSVASSVTDLSAIGTCMCRIELFAKNLSNGEKNGKKLSMMFSKLSGVFPITHDKYIFTVYPDVIPLGSDKYGFSVLAIQLETIIKTL